MDDEATQLTQGVYDPRRQGRNNSGLSSTDVADVLCILHPCSPAAFHVVTKTAIRSPQHVLQNNGSGFYDGDPSQKPAEEQETFILDQDRQSSERRNHSYDLALRFSARTVNPGNGFLFGRNAALSDIVLDTDSTKRVSNTHFRIYVNDQGVLMLQDLSTNGTLVDETHLKGKASRLPQTRMLNPGSIIQILTAKDEELVKFIVRIPSRDGHVDEYRDRLQAYMEKVAVANAKAQAARQGQVMQHLPAPVAPGTGPNGRGTSSSARMSLWPNKYGMRWDGGAKYNPAGLLGKGAFATVYMLATKSEGQLFAVKELEKRRFMKNGILDRKLDNEMQIMKGISHPNIVQYVEYEETTTDLYIIMEFVPYGDLQQYLGEKGPLPEDLAKTMAQQVFDAMTYLHNKRITHRDIKPDNILIANDDPNDFQVKLSDFGLSKVVKDNETFLKTFCGTLLYCAPEVFPHYDAHQASKGQKRTRRGTPQSAKYHSYSQPLLQQGVSREAISLLQDMLNTDPSERPSPAQCLRTASFAAYRDPSEILDSSPDRSRDVARSASVPVSVPQPGAHQVGRRLFGEIGQSALESSGVFGVYAKDDPLLARVLGESAKGQSVSAAPGEEVFATAVSHQPTASGNQEPDRPRPDSFTVPPSGDLEMVGGSLLGAESHFRDLNMESPQSANSPAGDLSEPTTPRTPEHPPQPSLGQADGATEETPTRAQEETPKPRTFRVARTNILRQPGTAADTI
ncbi:Protein kinase protein rad53 [Zalaria obscura]|uniref:Protein kinase protein rad53 n=1 Tax=Zalaria obscura TaxID=2024903 RepID=A0ACC3SH88_9PEZI